MFNDGSSDGDEAASGRCILLAGALLLTGCSLWGGSSKPKPADLGPNVPILGVRQAWTAKDRLHRRLPLEVQVNGNVVTVASADGAVAAIDARTGGDIWRASLGEPLSAGVGSDGKWTAVVTQKNDVVVLANARELWRQTLQAQSYTPPWWRAIVFSCWKPTASVAAFDAATGRQLWSQQRSGDPLVLRQHGVLIAVGDTLVAGLGGRLVGFNPDNGSIRWEAPVASSRAPTTSSGWWRSSAARAAWATWSARAPSRLLWVA